MKLSPKFPSRLFPVVALAAGMTAFTSNGQMPQEMSAEMQRGATPRTFDLCWDAPSGWVYFIHTSESLEDGSWKCLPVVVAGADAEEALAIDTGAPGFPKKIFYRISRAVDTGGPALEQDNDGDGLSNSTEFALETDPTSADADADADGLHYYAERLLGRDPAVADPLDDPSARALDVFNLSSF